MKRSGSGGQKGKRLAASFRKATAKECPFIHGPCPATNWPECPIYRVCLGLSGLLENTLAERPGMLLSEALEALEQIGAGSAAATDPAPRPTGGKGRSSAGSRT